MAPARALLRANLKTLLTLRDMTQTSLCAALGWSDSYLSGVLSGDTGMSLARLDALAAHLQVPVSRLFQGPAPPPQSPSGQTSVPAPTKSRGLAPNRGITSRTDTPKGLHNEVFAASGSLDSPADCLASLVTVLDELFLCVHRASTAAHALQSILPTDAPTRVSHGGRSKRSAAGPAAPRKAVR